MAVDFASLVLGIDSTQVKTGTVALNDLTAAGARAEAQTKRMTAAQLKAVLAVQQFARDSGRLTISANSATAAAGRMAAATTGMGAASGLARHHMANLTFQINDVIQGLAMGQRPMQIFAQQGFQVGQIAQQAGIGLGGLARAVGRLIAPFTTAIAIAAGLGVALMGVKRDAENADLDGFIQSLGLTKDEIEELTDTTITWGDVFGATMDVILERGGSSAEEVKGAWETALDQIGEFGKFSVAVLVGAFGALVQFVGSAAQNIGTLLAKGIEFGVNAALGMIEGLINGLVAGVNKVSGLFQALGVDLGTLGTVSLGRVQATGSFTSPFADAAGRFRSTFSDTMAGFDSIAAGADARRRGRIQDQANELIEDRNGASGAGRNAGKAHRDRAKALTDEERAYQQALKAAQGYLDGLQRETDAIGKNAVEQKRMEVAIAAAAARQAASVAPTKGAAQALLDQARAIEQAGAAWERVTNAQASADFISNVVEPLEFENRVMLLSIEAQRRLRAERELTLAGIDRGTEAWNRYIAATEKAVANDNFLADQQRLLGYVDDLSTSIADVITGARSLGEAFADVARSIIHDIIQMTVRMLIFRAISGIFGGGGGGSPIFTPSNPGVFANGGVFSNGNVVPFAMGGVVSSPTLFPMSGGKTGLMGESGDEAIMPLARDSRGRLGVRANDNQGGPIEVIVHVDASPDLMVKAAVVADSRIRVAEPRIVQQAANATFRAAAPKLMGGR